MRLFIATAAIVSFAVGAAAARPAAHDEQQSNQTQMRFAAMDRNGDGRITRDEWRGSARSFEVHDWNGDGVLSGAEVRVGAQWPPRQGNPADFNDWSLERFRWLDTNGDNRVSRSEWRYDTEDFFRADRNGDNFLSQREFQIGAEEDDDRGDRFAYLDQNNDNRIDRNEWHGSPLTFQWLDRNRDGLLSRAEVAGSETLGGSGNVVNARVAPRSLSVTARQPWTDTGIDVRPGDLVSVSATGNIMWSPSQRHVVPPAGGPSNASAASPRPDLAVGALLARVANGQPFLVGRGLDSYRAEQSGRLYLGVNDDRLDDNSGEFRAVVSVIRR